MASKRFRLNEWIQWLQEILIINENWLVKRRWQLKTDSHRLTQNQQRHQYRQTWKRERERQWWLEGLFVFVIKKITGNLNIAGVLLRTITKINTFLKDRTHSLQNLNNSDPLKMINFDKLISPCVSSKCKLQQKYQSFKLRKKMSTWQWRPCSGRNQTNHSIWTQNNLDAPSLEVIIMKNETANWTQSS